MIIDNELRKTLNFNCAIVWINDTLKSFYGAETKITDDTVEFLGQHGKKEIIRLYRHWYNDYTTELRYIVRAIESTIFAITDKDF